MVRRSTSTTPQSRKSKVVFELPSELREPPSPRLPPFFLGVVVTLGLLLIPTLSGLIWLCRLDDSTANDNTNNDNNNNCPRLVISEPVQQKKKSDGLLGLFDNHNNFYENYAATDQQKQQRRQLLQPEQVHIEFSPGQSAAKDCSICHHLSNLVPFLFGDSDKANTCSYYQRKSDNTEIPLSTCTPEIVFEEERKRDKGDSMSTTKSRKLVSETTQSSTATESHQGRSTEQLQKYHDLKTKRLSTAFTPEYLPVPLEHQKVISGLAKQCKEFITGWSSRVPQVAWGGPGGSAWYLPSYSPSSRPGPRTDLESLQGGALFYSYLRIMQWPQELHAKFPFKLCANVLKEQERCDSWLAMNHTLTFREIYQPWKVSPGVMQSNTNGCAFAHGFSPSRTDDELGNHSIVWIRPGQRGSTTAAEKDDALYTRILVNALERGVAMSLEHNDGRVGKFNVLIDGGNFRFGLLPSLHHLKNFVTILQDHYPDRLGVLVLVNLGGVGEFVVKLFLPLITEEVRNKIFVTPNDNKEKSRLERKAVLETVLGEENVPTWLEGSDPYDFASDHQHYYQDMDCFESDADANRYIQTMPYHA